MVQLRFILVEATGLEGVTETLKAFIYKGFRVFTPRRSPKTFIHFPNVINAYKKRKEKPRASLFCYAFSNTPQYFKGMYSVYNVAFVKFMYSLIYFIGNGKIVNCPFLTKVTDINGRSSWKFKLPL